MHCDIAKQDLTLRTVLTLARVAAGWSRRGLMVGRSGAGRADCPAVLAAGAHRTTHCAPCGRFVRTSAMRMLTKRAARAAPAAALLGAPQIAPAGSRLPRRWVVGMRYLGPRLPQTRSLAAKARGDSVRRASVALRSTGLAPSAKRVRGHAHRHCLSAESEANAASLAMRAQDRAPQGSLRVQRQTATVKRRTLSHGPLLPPCHNMTRANMNPNDRNGPKPAGGKIPVGPNLQPSRNTVWALK